MRDGRWKEGDREGTTERERIEREFVCTVRERERERARDKERERARERKRARERERHAHSQRLWLKSALMSSVDADCGCDCGFVGEMTEGTFQMQTNTDYEKTINIMCSERCVCDRVCVTGCV